MSSNEPKGYSDNSRKGVALVIGGLVLLIALAIAGTASLVNNGGNPTPSKPTPTHGPCATCIATPLPTATKPAPPTEVPTVPAPLPSEQPTLPAPAPTGVPTAEATAPEPVPTTGP